MSKGGAYGEHRLVSAVVSGEDNELPIDGPCLKIRLAPGAGTTLLLKMDRWALDPTFAFPWDR
jgi:hypothetical protein